MDDLVKKVRLILWFAARPSLWRHAFLFKLRKTGSKLDSAAAREEATQWALRRAVDAREALRVIGLQKDGIPLPAISAVEIKEAERRVAKSATSMGGPGDIALIHAAVVLTGANKAVETGVAFGWSTLAILTALEKLGDGRLASVDMPYPGMGNEAWVGVAVPERLRDRWTLIRKPDRTGLRQALSAFGNEIDFAHYDSDKSYWGRQFGYRLMWDSLVSGGVFISDDIQDNLAFRDFIASKGLPFSVTESCGKFVGLAAKP